MSVEYSPAAESDLADAIDYLAERSPAAAARLMDRVEQLAAKLDAGDFDGPMVTLTTGEQVRRWSLGYDYVLYYQRSGHLVRVVRVYHGAREPLAR